MTTRNGYPVAEALNISSLPSPPRERTGAVALLLIPLGFILGLLLGSWNSFVLYKLYGWFAVPVGAPELSWGQIWGLWMIFNTVVIALIPTPKSVTAAVANAVGTSFALAGSLLVGWIVSVMI